MKLRMKGLTVLELVVVIAILGILLGVAITLLNPQHQLSKVDDAKRRQDLHEIKTALDTYYNDHNCYPATLPFGSQWAEDTTVYMRQVPQDLACAANKNCYVYKYQGTCPQWNVVFAKLTNTPSSPQCALTKLSACVPQDYNNSWTCIVSGNVDAAGCGHISASSLSAGSDGAGGGGNGNGDIPTPTPTSVGCSKDYVCSNGTCNRASTGAGQYCSSTCDGMCTGR